MFKFVSLRKKLVFGVVLISTAITTLSVGITFFNDYRVEISQLNTTIASIENINLKPISRLVWDFNFGQIQTQLDSITKLPEVYSAKVIFADTKKELFSNDFEASQNLIVKKYDLNSDASGELRKIGELEIQYDKQNVLNKVYDKLLLFIILQFVKSFVISFLLFLYFQSLVTNRLELLNSTLKDLNNTHFQEIKSIRLRKLPPIVNSRDEITELRRIIQKMSYRMHVYNKSLNNRVIEAESVVETERAKAIYSSKMASLGEMAAGIAHEVNNPLAIIDGRIDLMQKYTKELPTSLHEKYLGDVGKIKSTTGRIAKIIKGLRYFAREGSQDPLEIVSFQTMLADTNSLILERMHSLGVEYKFSSVDFKIKCRPVEFSQVILNLVNNAVDAIMHNEQKWIKIEVELSDKVGVIRVVDSGLGISPEIEEKIMEPFFTTKEVGKGTGLGLSISKGIIEKIDGNLILNRNYQNTCFEIRIPIIE